MISPKKWQVSFHDAFDPEFDALPEDVQDELLAVAAALQELGPAGGSAARRHADQSAPPDMKELRFKAGNGTQIWRAAFAFDPDRKAVILVAADKQGIDEKKFYRDLLKKANARLDRHLQALLGIESVKKGK